MVRLITMIYRQSGCIHTGDFMPRAIYTRKGDQGDTSLACGSRLPKDDLRIEAYGTLDELSSVLGVVSALLKGEGKPAETPDWGVTLQAFIEWIQDKLFTMASMVATANLPAGNLPEITPEDVAFLERHIDEMESELPELRHFILPGGSELVSFIHIARTVCRRAERVFTTLSRKTSLNPVILPFLNRLGDELFVLARWVCYRRGEQETVWLGRKHPESNDLRVAKHCKLIEKLLQEEGAQQLQLFSQTDEIV